MTATAVEDLHLLKIRSEDFYDLPPITTKSLQRCSKLFIERVESLVTD